MEFSVQLPLCLTPCKKQLHAVSAEFQLQLRQLQELGAATLKRQVCPALTARNLSFTLSQSPPLHDVCPPCLVSLSGATWNKYSPPLPSVSPHFPRIWVKLP